MPQFSPLWYINLMSWSFAIISFIVLTVVLLIKISFLFYSMEGIFSTDVRSHDIDILDGSDRFRRDRVLLCFSNDTYPGAPGQASKLYPQNLVERYGLLAMISLAVKTTTGRNMVDVQVGHSKSHYELATPDGIDVRALSFRSKVSLLRSMRRTILFYPFIPA